MSRREAVLAEVQEHYYARPPRIERGWRHHLVADDGRVFLDMVTMSRCSGTVTRGWRVRSPTSRALSENSNSRFHYASIVALAEEADGAASGAPRHGIPRQLRLGGRRAGPPSRARAHRTRRSARSTRRLPRLDVPGRCGVHLECRQSACTRVAARMGAHPGGAERLPRPLPGRRGATLCAGRHCSDTRARRVGATSGGVHLRTGLRQRRRSDVACRLPGSGVLGGAPAGGLRSRTKCRSGSVGWAPGSGAFSSRASCPMWSRSPSLSVTGIPWARWSRPRRSPQAMRRRGTSSRLPVAVRFHAWWVRRFWTSSPRRISPATR